MTGILKVDTHTAKDQTLGIICLIYRYKFGSTAASIIVAAVNFILIKLINVVMT